MAVYELDEKGMACPGPTLKMTSMTFRLKPGDTQEVIADCPAFEKLCGIGAIATRRYCSGTGMKALKIMSNSILEVING